MIPSSCANVIALVVAMATTMTSENGKGACFDSEAIAFPWLPLSAQPCPTRKKRPHQSSI